MSHFGTLGMNELTGVCVLVVYYVHYFVTFFSRRLKWAIRSAFCYWCFQLFTCLLFTR